MNIELLQQLREISKNLRGQDNRGTDAPIFIVQQKTRMYGIDDAYTTESVWVDKGDWSEVKDDSEIARLDTAEENGDEIEGYERCGIRDEWEFVTACFTESGAQDYLRVNGHNLREPRIYAAGSFRNEEFRLVRQFLISLE